MSKSLNKTLIILTDVLLRYKAMRCPECSGSMKATYNGIDKSFFLCSGCGHTIPRGKENVIDRARREKS